MSGRLAARRSGSRREFLTTAAAALAATALPSDAAPEQARPEPARAGALPEVSGSEHFTTKRAGAEDVRLFLWRKRLRDASAGAGRRGTILFVHCSSISSTPTFDLQIPGRLEASAMDWFARLGYDTWCVDCEGYGRSDKSRRVNADVASGADDLAAASDHIMKQTGGGKLL